MKKRGSYLILISFFLILTYQNCGDIGVVSTRESSLCLNGDCESEDGFRGFHQLTNHRLVMYAYSGQSLILNIYDSRSNLSVNPGVFSEVVSNSGSPADLMILKTPAEDTFHILVKYLRGGSSYFKIIGYRIKDNSLQDDAFFQAEETTFAGTIFMSRIVGIDCNEDGYEDFYINQLNTQKLICISGRNLSQISEISNVTDYRDHVGDFNNDRVPDFISHVSNSNVKIWNLILSILPQNIIFELGRQFSNFSILKAENLFDSTGNDLFIYGLEGNYSANISTYSRSFQALTWNSASSQVTQIFRDSIPSSMTVPMFTHGSFTNSNKYEYVYPSEDGSVTNLIFRQLNNGSLSTIHSLFGSQVSGGLSSLTHLLTIPDLNADGLNEIGIVLVNSLVVINPRTGALFYRAATAEYGINSIVEVKIFGN